MDWIHSRTGVGPKRAQVFLDAGLREPEDILRRTPASYRDWDARVPIAALRPGQTGLFEARVRHVSTGWHSKGLSVTRARLEDATGFVTAVFFNQPYRREQLTIGGDFVFHGRVERRAGAVNVVCPIVRDDDPRGIEPVYAPLEGVPRTVYARIVEDALRDAAVEDALPQAVLAEHHLLDKAQALYAVHMPNNADDLLKALRRERFERLFLFQLGIKLFRDRESVECAPIPGCVDDLEPLLSRLPYSLTGAQERVVTEILADMNRASPMARMVQGDVGSGKTIVAFCALYLAAKAGYQAAMMAPTEVLAAQHEAAARELLEPLGIRVGRLSGSHTRKQRRETLERIADGDFDVMIGTHALFVGDVQFKNLALAITDEQHRFGVRQRQALADKGHNPHVLVMSATPIPRTLSLIIYGDLNVSLIDAMPPGRKPIQTRVVPDQKRAGMYGFMSEQVKRGRQCYVVCPLIEESEAADAASAIGMSESVSEAMPGARVGLLHGGMRPLHKEEVLGAFSRGEIDVLVSTTVVEVGVNVPNATVMVVEDAERFGLAQLHQLRGRIGRGEHESWCFLMAQDKGKLKILTETNDGFVIARADLEQRGPGDMYGVRQSGEAGSLDASLGSDLDLIYETRDAAERYVSGEYARCEKTDAAAREAMGTGDIGLFLH